MKIFKIIGKAIKSVAKFFGKAGKETGKVITNAFDELDDVGKVVVPIAVNVVQMLKTIVESPITDVVTKIITTAIPGEKDDILVEKVKTWLQKELPKLAIKLTLANSIITTKSVDDKVNIIIQQLQKSEFKGRFALEFAAQLALYLSDGELTTAEYQKLKKAAEEYYLEEVKK